MIEVREVIQAQIDRLTAALAALDGNTASHTKIADTPHKGNGVVHHHRRKGGHIRKCKGCPKKFVAYDPRQLFHNKRCLSAYHAWNRDLGMRDCAFDGQSFMAKRKGQKYCGKSHAMKHRMLLDSEAK